MPLQDVAGGKVRPDGSVEWNVGFGPGGYDQITNDMTKQNTKYLSGLPGGDQQANRWQAFGMQGRPPEADSVAPRGTEAWREAWRQNQAWLTAMAQHGASPSDLGLSPTVGHGLANFSRWGEIQDYANQEARKGNWLDPNKGTPYEFRWGQGGQGGQGGGQAPNPGGLGFGQGGAPALPTVGGGGVSTPMGTPGGTPTADPNFSAPVLDAFGRPRRGTRTGLQGLAMGTHNAFDPVNPNG